MEKLFLSILCLTVLTTTAATENRWQMRTDGSTVWQVTKDLPHEDHIEMSGRQVSIVFRYGVDDKKHFLINKSLVWPMLRTKPNNTHASLMRRFEWDPVRAIATHNYMLNDETVDSMSLNGILRV